MDIINNELNQFVIVSPPYHPNNGGSMVLYYLCKLLNDQGHKAKIFLQFSTKDFTINFRYFLRLLKFKILSIIVKKVKSYKWMIYKQSPIKASTLLIPVINKRTIVIYPEIISGNPLKAFNVVRWLLYKPGFFTGKINFGKNDLFFCYDELYNDEMLNPSKNTMKIIYFKEIYKQTNFEPRRGKCYIIRKGKGRNDLPNTFDGPIIDKLSDEEIVEIFNKCEYCISYDQHTMYTSYAAICGCIPIIIPIDGVKEKRQSNYGHAYGFDTEEIQHAKETRTDLVMELKRMEMENVNQIKNFVSICNKYFSNG
jgi:hypothetical protein